MTLVEALADLISSAHSRRQLLRLTEPSPYPDWVIAAMIEQDAHEAS
jgi:hypothetical protein